MPIILRNRLGGDRVNRDYKLYVHINKANSKRYFGITKQKSKDRWRNGTGYKKNRHFARAINKY